MTGIKPPPLVAHVLYSFDIGGLENGIVNLINHMPADRFRHVVIALARCSPEFCKRVTRDDVEFVSIDKPVGHGMKVFGRVYRELRRRSPAIVHTRNLAALEMTVPAWVARVPVRIHGEHGWDNGDPGGASRKYRWVRRLYSPFVTQYIALSGQISRYLTQDVGIAGHRVERICNGVDTARFDTGGTGRLPGAPQGFERDGAVIFGTVGRLQAVKDQLSLVRAFSAWCASGGVHGERARLVIVGDGPMRGDLVAEIDRCGLRDKVWMTGARHDVPALMRGMDVFVLPSMAEGISNTLLEAMSSRLPVIATDVGGNPELVVNGQNGFLVPAGQPQRWIDSLQALAEDEGLRRAMSVASRRRVEANFSLDVMVNRYMAVYERALAGPAGKMVATSKVG